MLNYYTQTHYSSFNWGRGAILSNITAFQKVSILTSVPTDKFLLLLLYLGCTTDHRQLAIQCCIL